MRSSPCQRFRVLLVRWRQLAAPENGAAFFMPRSSEITERQRASVPHPGPAVQAAAEASDAPAAADPSQDGVRWSDGFTPSDSASAAGGAPPAVTEFPDMPGFLMRKKMKCESA